MSNLRTHANAIEAQKVSTEQKLTEALTRFDHLADISPNYISPN